MTDSKEDVVRFVFVKDPHFDLEGPPSRKDDYLEAVLNKFSQVAQICRAVSADALLLPGDIFLKFSPSTVKHPLVGIISECFRKIPCPVAGIVGNHDAQRGIIHLDKYPISTLIKAGVYQYVVDNPLVVEKPGIKVKVSGYSYSDDAYDQIVSYPKGDEDYLVMLAHFFLGHNKGDFFGERVYGMNEFGEAGFDVLAVGHEHVNQGVFSKYGKHFINSGQMVRVSSSKSDRDLIPQVVVFSLSKESGFKYTVVPIKCGLSSEIFATPEQYSLPEQVPDLTDFKSTLSEDVDWVANSAHTPSMMLENLKKHMGEDWSISDSVYLKTLNYLGGS